MSSRLRLTALLALGALALHQLRYLVAHGEQAGAALASEGHAYLGVVALVVAVVLGAAMLDFGLALLRARGGAPSAGRRWLALSSALLVIYVCQESLEGVLVAHHASGLAAVLGNGGWVSLPLALAIGGIVAVLLRGAELAIGTRRRGRRPAPRAGVVARLESAERLSANLLARHLAGRAPPSYSCG